MFRNTVPPHQTYWHDPSVRNGLPLQVQACTVADIPVSNCQPCPTSVTPASHVLPNRTEHDLPFDQFLARPHLLEQRRVANDPRGVLDLAARLVQSRNDAHNRAFHDIRQICDAVE
jgi:hypothetical protein